MIFIALHDREIHFKSDTSTKELNEFCDKTKLYVKRYNRHSLGLYKTHEMSFVFGEQDGIGQKHIDLFNDTEIDYKILEFGEWNSKAWDIKKAIPPTSEKVIRDAVEKELKSKYDFCHWQREFTHTALDVRADLFGVTRDKKVISVEIKSDRDSLARLEKQIKGYSVFSHIVYLATDIRHFAKVEKMLHDRSGMYGVGVFVYENGEFIEHKKPQASRCVDATKILWKQEFQRMLSPFNFKGQKSCSSGYLEALGKNIFTVAEYNRVCEHLFVDRYLCEDEDNTILLSLFGDIEYKQKLIESLT